MINRLVHSRFLFLLFVGCTRDVGDLNVVQNRDFDEIPIFLDLPACDAPF